MVIKNFRFMIFVLAATSCTKKTNSHPDAKELNVHCNMDSRILEKNRVVFVEKEKSRLFREEFTASPY